MAIRWRQESRNYEPWKHSIRGLVCAPLQFWLFRKHVLQGIIQAQSHSLLADTHIFRAMCSDIDLHASLIFQTLKTMVLHATTLASCKHLQGPNKYLLTWVLSCNKYLAVQVQSQNHKGSFGMDHREHMQFPLPRPWQQVKCILQSKRDLTSLAWHIFFQSLIMHGARIQPG